MESTAKTEMMLAMTGSPTLVRSLLRDGVLDELRLLVHPIVVGQGKRLFEDGGDEDLRCVSNGVLAPIVGVVGSLQATEALKVLAGFGTPLVGRLLLLDGLRLQFREINFNQNRHCPVCGAA